ncbi:amino acid adenylation domain-containing protein [Streptomyces sudanensis]|uniref:amino acid adenylation domain-containing protein n=1 Tax=Streptomyces sudanensis TaxID=436397 RepID=UPI0020CBDA0C|nr:amino acid adenylation domain-containing protein [Streptomyces sudanensis]MCP9956154.1 amino acid adenylation domain-containing protein [Streptomyces sudanensis]
MTEETHTRTDSRLLLGPAAEHGFALRLSGPARVARAAAGIARSAAFPRPDGTAGHWIQDAAAPSTGSHHGLREARRPLGPGGFTLRVVLTRYRDGAADLGVTARRDTLDPGGLRALARALAAAGAGPSDVPAAPSPAAPVGWRPASVPAWGLADGPGAPLAPLGPEGETAGRAPVSPVSAVAAAALALSRYARTPAVRLAVVSDGAVEHVPGAGVVRIDVDEDLPVGQYLDQVASRLRGPGEPGGTESPPLCLVLTGGHPDETYVPFAPDAFPLTLAYAREGDGVVPAATARDPRAVHATVAGAFARQVARLATRLGRAGAGQPLGDLPSLSDEEARAVVALGDATAPAAPGAGTVPGTVAFLARTRPDALAVTDDRRRLTYRELDERATAWARALAGHGVAPGDFVGVCLKRTTDLVVALLAVLKAGAAYVPLDPHAPDERLRHIAEDAGLSAVVSTVSAFPAPPGTPVLAPAALTAAAERARDAELPVVRPQDDAYVIYTSGTTGRPKGVVVPHANVLALLEATREELALGPDDVWSFFHSAAFDFSVWEIWGCLLTGGRLVVVPYLVTRSPEDFHALLAREGVTVLSQTPSAFAGLLEADAAAGGPAPRVVVFGGEAFDPGMLGGWFRRHPPAECRLVNMYGITETTVHVTLRDVVPWDSPARARCVGRPLAGWSVSVRDARGRPLPPGAVGEIWVGGAGLARHYLGRPDLTAERFVTDGLTGRRLYRSGDLGRLRPDGSLDHAGRLDDQVKIRGFRIELGEIRSVLLDDPGVTDAAVLVRGREDGPAHTGIVAYVVPSDNTRPIDVADVRRRAAGLLPDYMVPSELIALPALPLTINGKLDKAALLRKSPREAPAAAPDPTDPALARVLSLWRAVVQPDAEPDAHFFENGGNSLLAVKLLGALRKAGFGPVALPDLYAHPTPSALAACLEPGTPR